MLLDVKDLCASVEDNAILKGINFQVKRGEVHAIMGPNGSGKSTFSKVLVGHPSYEVTGGTAEYRKGEDLLDLEPEDRAQQGVFLAFQYPVEIAGVSNSDFLRLAVNKRRGALGLPEHDPIEFFGVLAEKMQTVGLTPHPNPKPNPNPNPNPNSNPNPNPNPILTLTLTLALTLTLTPTPTPIFTLARWACRTTSSGATSTAASRAARRSGTRSCRWRCSDPSSPSLTRPTRASTSTRSRRWRPASTPPRAPRTASS